MLGFFIITIWNNMKQWTKNNMKLLSKLRANSKQNKASMSMQGEGRPTTPRELAAMEEAEISGKPSVEGPYNPLACCNADTSTSITGGATAAGSSTAGSGNASQISGYRRYDDNGAPFDENKIDKSQQFQTTSNQQHQQHPHQRPHIIKELFHFFTKRSWKKKLFTILVICMIVPVIYDIVFLQSDHVTNFLDNFLEWMANHPITGVWAYIAMIAFTSLIFIPPSILIFAAGFTFQSLWDSWGILVALVASYMGSMIGGLAGFWRAKYMTRDLIEVLMRRYPIIRALDAAIIKNSLRVMVLLRLNPLIPFGVLNYAFGITGVDWVAFMLAIVGVLPWHLLLIFLGASSATMYDTSTEITVMEVVLIATGIAFGIIGLAITWKFAKKELQKEVDSTPAITANDYRLRDPNLRPYRSPNRKMPRFLTKRQSEPTMAGMEVINVEDADLNATDYFLIQCLGEDSRNVVEVDGNGVIEEDYQTKLTWNEIILDDFS